MNRLLRNLILMTATCWPGLLVAEYQITLQEAIDSALANNSQRLISRAQLDIAEAQYQQAMSAYWPSVDLNAMLERRDEDATFTIEGISASAATAFGPIAIDVPATEVTLFDRDTGVYSLDLSYPLYTGGKRGALVEQAKVGKAIAAEGVRRTDLQLVYDVKRYYHAAVLTSELAEIAEDTYVSLEVARDITKAFFEGGSASVDRRDYLQSEIALTTVDGLRTNLEANHASALAALRFAMGGDWNEPFTIVAESATTRAANPELDYLVQQAESFNPDIASLELSVQAADSAIKAARSGHLPKVLLQGSVRHYDNSFDAGLVNRRNTNTWSIGVVMQLPLFRGFRTQGEVAEAKFRKAEYQAQRVLVGQAVASQLRNHFIEYGRALKLSKISEQAVKHAVEHAELTDSAYQSDLLETKELIEAYFLNSLIKSNHVKAVHDTGLNEAAIEFLIGGELSGLN